MFMMTQGPLRFQILFKTPEYIFTALMQPYMMIHSIFLFLGAVRK